ncbi:hypothetical protein EYF80_061404 [Liparis tanakae]|uniref:Uncharacterized protein n=1 Tax=Liparis tanakae TaxID=230148 RepID=A0A4Z2EI31_9TELE|nr:hypothetical protein EYF80_061404 [Liparis tanakae]
MLRYMFPSCRSIRIRMILMSGPEPWALLGGLLPQEMERRWDLTGVDGVCAAEPDSLAELDVSTSRQDTDGDLMCCGGEEVVSLSRRRRRTAVRPARPNPAPRLPCVGTLWYQRTKAPSALNTQFLQDDCRRRI